MSYQNHEGVHYKIERNDFKSFYLDKEEFSQEKVDTILIDFYENMRNVHECDTCCAKINIKYEKCSSCNFKNHMKKLCHEVIDKCPICLDPIYDNDSQIKTKCKHLFHRKCLYIWKRRNNSCPICRTKLPECMCCEEEHSDSEN